MPNKLYVKLYVNVNFTHLEKELLLFIKTPFECLKCTFVLENVN